MLDPNHGTDNNSHHQLPRQLTTSSRTNLSNRLNQRYPSRAAAGGAIAIDNAQATWNLISVRENILAKQQDHLLDRHKATSHHDDILSRKSMPHQHPTEQQVDVVICSGIASSCDLSESRCSFDQYQLGGSLVCNVWLITLIWQRYWSQISWLSVILSPLMTAHRLSKQS